MKNTIEKIRKIAIIILTLFSLLITISNYLNLHTFDIFNSNHYPRTYSILMIMIWLYILILARKRIFEVLKSIEKKKLNKTTIAVIITFGLIFISLFSTLKVWASDYTYTKFILFSFVNLAILYIEKNNKKEAKKKIAKKR